MQCDPKVCNRETRYATVPRRPIFDMLNIPKRVIVLGRILGPKSVSRSRPKGQSRSTETLPPALAPHPPPIRAQRNRVRSVSVLVACLERHQTTSCTGTTCAPCMHRVRLREGPPRCPALIAVIRHVHTPICRDLGGYPQCWSCTCVWLEVPMPGPTKFGVRYERLSTGMEPDIVMSRLIEKRKRAPSRTLV
jgi:hypothetical protein